MRSDLSLRGKDGHRVSIKEFFKKVVPRNRLRHMIEKNRERAEKRREEIIWNNQFYEVDKILAGDEVMQWDLGEEFVHDADSWLRLQNEEEKERSLLGKRSRPETFDDEARALEEDRRWLHSIEREYLGYRPNPMGVGDNVYRGASVAEGVNIPGVNLSAQPAGPQEPVDIPMVYDGVPVSGTTLPPGFGEVDMVEVEVVPPLRPLSVPVPGVDNDVVNIEVNPFSKEELAKVLKKTRQSPFKKKKK